MEDYEYLWLLSGGDPEIGIENGADTQAGQFIASRARFSHVPTDLDDTRAGPGGLVANQATFSGTKQFGESAQLPIYSDQPFLPVILK